MNTEDSLISSNANIEKDAVLVNPVRIYDNVTIQEKTRIGKYTHISENSIIGESCVIGNYCSIARDVKISIDSAPPTNYLSSHPFQYSPSHFDTIQNYFENRNSLPTPHPTMIGHDVWIGSNVTVYQGITVGTGAIIASNSVVTEDIPPYAEVSGSPAQVKRFRFDEKTIADLLASQWWELEPQDMADLDFQKPHEALDRISALKLNMTLKNRNMLSNVISNSASGTNSGIVWFSTPYAHADMSALERYNAVEIIMHAPSADSTSEVLLPGIYPIAKAAYDEKRGRYRLDVLVNGTVFKGKIAKNKLRFKLMVN